MLDHAGENASPQDDERLTPQGWILGNTKICPVLKVKVTYHLYQYGIEIKVDSMKNDGSLSWIVISKGMNKIVDGLPEENAISIHYEEMVTGTERPVATKQKEQSTPRCADRSTEVERHSCR